MYHVFFSPHHAVTFSCLHTPPAGSNNVLYLRLTDTLTYIHIYKPLSHRYPLIYTLTHTEYTNTHTERHTHSHIYTLTHTLKKSGFCNAFVSQKFPLTFYSPEKNQRILFQTGSLSYHCCLWVFEAKKAVPASVCFHSTVQNTLHSLPSGLLHVQFWPSCWIPSKLHCWGFCFIEFGKEQHCWTLTWIPTITQSWQ